MSYFVVKVLVSAILVGLISEFARRSPAFAALVSPCRWCRCSR